MAWLGKFLGALRSAAKSVFSSRKSSPKEADLPIELPDYKEEPSQTNECVDGTENEFAPVPVDLSDTPTQCIPRTSSFVKKARLIEYGGEKKTAKEWAEKLGVSTTAIRRRLRKYGSILSPATSEAPVAKFNEIKLVKDSKGTLIEADGTTYTLFQFSKVFGIKFSTLYGRVQKGWDIQEIINQPRDVQRDYTKSPPVKSKLWEWKGEKHTVSEWAKIYGIQTAMMRKRLTAYGSPERNTDKLESYKQRRARRFEWKGETHTAKEWAEIYKVPLRTMMGRLHAHNSPEVKHSLPAVSLKHYEWNGESLTAKEWAEKTKQSVKTVRAHFRENGTPFTTFKENKGHFKEKSYTWNGVIKKASEWAEEYNCTVNAVHKRFRKNGSPVDNGKKCTAHYFTFKGQTHTYKEWGEKYRITAAKMYMRIKRHRSPEPPEKTTPIPVSIPDKPIKVAVYVDDEESSDTELYWSDGECKKISEWASEYGIPRADVKRNFERYGTPIKPQYDYADLEENVDLGESEENIDAMLQEIDKKQKNGINKTKETIQEWLERIKNEPEDDRPLREILGCPSISWGRNEIQTLQDNI